MAQTTKPASLKKSAFLTYWRKLKPNQKIKPAPVPYKHAGSTYGEDGIRITGSREFVDSVLSRLQDLLEYESDTTRLSVTYAEQTGRTRDKDGKPIFSKDGTGQWSCYIKVAERGIEAQVMNLRYGRLGD